MRIPRPRPSPQVCHWIPRPRGRHVLCPRTPRFPLGARLAEGGPGYEGLRSCVQQPRVGQENLRGPARGMRHALSRGVWVVAVFLLTYVSVLCRA